MTMRKDELCDVNGNASKALETGTQKLKTRLGAGYQFVFQTHNDITQAFAAS